MSPLFNKDSSWDIDLEFGEIQEKKIADILQDKKIEVKSDRGLWKQTGNFVVEFEYKNNPSGISITKSNFWMQNLTDGKDMVFSLLLPTETIRRYIRETNPKTFENAKGNNGKCYLINIHSLFDFLMDSN